MNILYDFNGIDYEYDADLNEAKDIVLELIEKDKADFEEYIGDKYADNNELADDLIKYYSEELEPYQEFEDFFEDKAYEQYLDMVSTMHDDEYDYYNDRI